MGDWDPPYDATAPIAGVPAPPPDGHASAPDLILTPPLVAAYAAVTTMRGLIGKAAFLGAKEAEAEVQRLQEENRRLKDERDYPDLLRQWADNTGSFTRKDRELVRAAERAAAETAAGAS